MHGLDSWCERYQSGTGARQSDRSRPLDKNLFRTLPAPLRSHALTSVHSYKTNFKEFSRPVCDRFKQLSRTPNNHIATSWQPLTTRAVQIIECHDHANLISKA